ncbi:WbaZ-like glycosyltransferase [Rosistilla carotiformis]|uniref:WbaZ-like glycosyltransferase n=2 Tax=Rosistilla carotiformis TaxID=2528017 RepID=A0A518JLE4_9BACT|nr:WbaZ-like glycosyltransferase [Rosistilla carotiformis]
MITQILPYLPLIVSAIVALCCVPLTMRMASGFGLVDRPDARKIHTIPTPRLGGIAIFAGMVLGVFSLILARQLIGDPVSRDTLTHIMAIITASSFVFSVGLVDDLRTVSSRFKLAALVAAGAMVCGSGIVLSDLTFGGHAFMQFPWMSWGLTILWMITVSVAINFIDGLDGLAGGLTLLSAAVLSAVAIQRGSADVAIIPLALVGGLAGFLVFNWHPAKTFMGDCGSMTIGFVLASSMVLANPSVGSMRGLVLPAVALSIPLVDTALTVFRRRYLQRRSMFAAERGHIHHHLLDRGLRHVHAVLVIYLVSAVAVLIGFVSLAFEGLGTLGGLSLLAPLIWGIFRLAGSMRTNEMVAALRLKRDNDRVTKRYRATFEDLQLEFNHVGNFSQWWDGICNAAQKLDFVSLRLDLPGKEDGRRGQRMEWETDSSDLKLCETIQASIPVTISQGFGETATLSVHIAAVQTLESASERLGLFTRLVTEFSLLRIREKEHQSRRRRSPQDGSRTPDSLEQSLQFRSSGKSQFAHLRVALVHDFFYTYCGAERVFEQLLDVFPHADVHALFDFLPDDQRGFLGGRTVTTSFLQHMPFAQKKHRAYLPLMPLAIEQIDVSDYDLVVSSSYVAAKGVITGPDQLHVCYCHSPVRFAWDLHHQYLDQAGLGFGPKGLLSRTILHYIRSWDVRSSLGVDHFIANSRFVGRRIKKFYRRNSTVVHPPVDTDQFELNESPRDDFYLIAGRMVGYKKTELMVRAFAKMPDRKLIVIGEGPDFQQVQNVATENVTLLGFQPSDVLVDHMRHAKALLFAAEEDFGIVPVEALACGTPVIAYGKGGVTESVIDGEHGVLYDEQTEESIVDAIERFEAQAEFGKFDPRMLRQRAECFSNSSFAKQITDAVLRWTGKQDKKPSEVSGPREPELVNN